MCGIWGYISSSFQNDEYFDNIEHRGPDYKKLLKFLSRLMIKLHKSISRKIICLIT